MKWLWLLCLVTLLGCDEGKPPVAVPHKSSPEEIRDRLADANDAPGRFTVLSVQDHHTGNWMIFKVDTITGRTWRCYNFSTPDLPDQAWIEVRDFHVPQPAAQTTAATITNIELWPK